MKKLAFLLVLLAVPASAKDLTITTTDAEQQALVQGLDALVKTQGLVLFTDGRAAAINTLYQKLQQAAQASPPAPDAPQGGTK